MTAANAHLPGAMPDYLPGGPSFGAHCVHDQLARSCPTCEHEAEVAELEAENARLRAALGRYGRHIAGCRTIRTGRPCDCGLDDVRNAD